MNIRLIALDLDDTLLDEQQRLTVTTISALQRAMQAGVSVTIATGRMFCSTVPFARQLGITLPLITYNGALIRRIPLGETLYHQPIELSLAEELTDLFRQRGWYLQKYVDDRLYVLEMNEDARYYAEYAKVEAIPLGEDFYRLTVAPTKMLSMGSPDELATIAAEVKSRYAGRLYVAASKQRYLELVDARVNKGRALEFLAGSLGIHQQEVMAIGDSMNDLDMIQYAGIGVAMGNANPAVKEVADFVTRSNVQDGVAAAVEKFLSL